MPPFLLLTQGDKESLCSQGGSGWHSLNVHWDLRYVEFIPRETNTRPRRSDEKVDEKVTLLSTSQRSAERSSDWTIAGLSTLFLFCFVFYFQVNSWGSWGVCSEKCAVGTKQRTRTVKISKRCRGRDCPALRVRIYCPISWVYTYCCKLWGCTGVNLFVDVVVVVLLKKNSSTTSMSKKSIDS